MLYHAQTVRKLMDCGIDINAQTKRLWAPTRVIVKILYVLGIVVFVVGLLLGLIGLGPLAVVGGLLGGIGSLLASYMLRFAVDMHVMLSLLLDAQIRHLAQAAAQAQEQQPRRVAKALRDLERDAQHDDSE